MGEWWSVDRRERVAVCTFTRPPRNFMSFAAMTELKDLLGELAEDTSVQRASLAAAKRAVVEGMRSTFGEGLRLEGRLFIERQTGQEALKLQDSTLEGYGRGAEPI